MGESMDVVKVVGGGLSLPFRHNGTSCVPKGAVNDLQTTLRGKPGCQQQSWMTGSSFTPMSPY